MKIRRMEIEGLLKGFIVWGYKSTDSVIDIIDFFYLQEPPLYPVCSEILSKNVGESRRSAIKYTVWTVPVKPISEK